MQIVDLRMEKDSNSKFDILHIPIGSLCKDFVLSSLDVVDDRYQKESGSFCQKELRIFI